MMRGGRFHRAGWLAVVAVVIGGCGGGDDLGTVPVTGVITLDGAPVPGAVVAFSAGVGEGTASGQFSCYTDDDGEFTMMHSKSVEGLRPGEYRVTVRSVADLFPGGGAIAPPGGPSIGKPTDAAQSAPQKLPEKYMSFEKSGLTASVKSDEDNHFNFALSSSQ
jgi:hypothetical protein